MLLFTHQRLSVSKSPSELVCLPAHLSCDDKGQQTATDHTRPAGFTVANV